MDKARLEELKEYFIKENIKFYSHYDGLIYARLKHNFKLTEDEIDEFFKFIYPEEVKLERTESVMF